MYVNRQSNRLFFAGLTSMSCLVVMASGFFSYSTLKAIQNANKSGDDEKKSSMKWFVASSTLSILAGAIFAVTAWFLPQRSIQKLSYLPKREMIKVGVYTPLGSHQEFLVPVNNISSNGNSSSPAHKPLSVKVKGHSLFYLVDLEATFQSRKLFDTLISNSSK